LPRSRAGFAPTDTGEARTRAEQRRRTGTTTAGGAFVKGRIDKGAEVEKTVQQAFRGGADRAQINRIRTRNGLAALSPEEFLQRFESPEEVQRLKEQDEAREAEVEAVPSEAEPIAAPVAGEPADIQSEKNQIVSEIAQASAAGQDPTALLRELDVLNRTGQSQRGLGQVEQGLPSGGAATPADIEAGRLDVGKRINQSTAAGTLPQDMPGFRRELDELERAKGRLSPEDQDKAERLTGDSTRPRIEEENGEATGADIETPGEVTYRVRNMESKNSTHRKIFFNGTEYDLQAWETWPVEVVSAVKAHYGLTPKEYVNQQNEIWLDRHGWSGLSPGGREAAKAAMMHGGVVVKEQGFFTAAGDQLVWGPEDIVNAVQDPTAETGPGGEPLIREIADVAVQEAKPSGTFDDAGLDTALSAQDNLTDLDDSLEEYEDLDPTESIETSRTRMLSDTASTMRAAMNRMARGRSSPEAMSSASAQLQQNSEIAFEQGAAQIRFQTEQQNFQNRLAIYDRHLAVARDIFNSAVSVDEQRKARNFQRSMQRGRDAMALKAQEAANEFNVGQFLLQTGIGVAGAFTGGFATAAGAALIGNVAGGGSPATRPDTFGRVRGNQFTLNQFGTGLVPGTPGVSGIGGF